MTTIPEAISRFYELKQNYEGERRAAISQIRRDKNLTKTQKQEQLQKLGKPKCINCKREVGSIFEVYTDRETAKRVFVAKCGDVKTPCPLNIQISLDTRLTFEELLKEDTHDIDSLKSQIVKLKNDEVYGFVSKDTITPKFEELVQNLKNRTADSGKVYEDSVMALENPKKITELNRDKIQLAENIRILKNMLVDVPSETKFASAAELYHRTIQPLSETIREKTYAINEIDATKTGIRLYQREHSLKQNEYDYGIGEDKIERFVEGMPTTAPVAAKKPRKKAAAPKP